MGYIAITNAEIVSGKPVDEDLLTKIQGNFAYLYGKTQEGIPPLNGSFEIDTDADGIPDNWSRNLYPGGSSGIYTTDPSHGAKALYFTHPGGSGNGGGYLTSDYLEVSELIPYYLNFEIWATAAGMKCYAQILQYNKSKGALSTQTLYLSTSNPTSQTPKVIQFTPSAGACFAKVRFIGGYTDTDVAGTVYFDNCFILPAIIEDMIVDASVTQAKLKTATGENSEYVQVNPGSDNSVYDYFVPTGGQYILGKRYKYSYTEGPIEEVKITVNDEAVMGDTMSTSYGPSLYMYVWGKNSSGPSISYLTGYCEWTYVNSSGELVWLFAKRDKTTKIIVETNLADNHPCFGTTCDPEKTPHPFLSVKDTEEIVCCILTDEQWEHICDEAENYGDSKLHALTELYDIDELSNPEWPTKEVTVGLPKKIEVDGKMVPVDWRFMPPGTNVTPVKRTIPKPAGVIHAELKEKAAAAV